MAQVIQGDDSLFSSAIFGEPDWGTLQFLSNQYTNISNHLSESSASFFSAAKDTYEKISGSAAMRTARAAARKITHMWDKDEIRQLDKIGDFQQSKLTMQRWIMAQPYVRSLYFEQRIDGYSESYANIWRTDIGADHIDYQIVMHGVVEEKDDRLLATSYYIESEEKPLSIEEKNDILISWENVVRMLKTGNEDPTSKWAAGL